MKWCTRFVTINYFFKWKTNRKRKYPIKINSYEVVYSLCYYKLQIELLGVLGLLQAPLFFPQAPQKV